MLFDVSGFITGIFYAATGIAVMLGVPMLALKYKGGGPLLAIATSLALYYAYEQGYIVL